MGPLTYRVCYATDVDNIYGITYETISDARSFSFNGHKTAVTQCIMMFTIPDTETFEIQLDGVCTALK